MELPEISAVSVAYQSRKTIGATLEALKKAGSEVSLEVIVVDNSSSDGTADFVRRSYPYVKFISNGKNTGFGRGCNIGIEKAKAPLILLINPDAVIETESLKKLIEFMTEHPLAGICGPAVVEESGALQPSGGLPNPWKVIIKPIIPSAASKGQNHVSPGDPPERTDWVCGSLMLLRRTMLESVGLFDPRFFLYFEETDLCRRALESGWEIWTTGEAVGRHVNAASAKAVSAEMIWGTISEHYFKSRFYYMKKYYGIAGAFAAEAGEIVTMSARAVMDAVRGRKYPFLKQRMKAPKFKLPDAAGITEKFGRKGASNASGIEIPEEA